MRVDAATVQRKTSTPSAPAKAVSSFHRTSSHRSIKPPPTVVNNFMNDMNGEGTSRREHNTREEKGTSSGGCGSANSEKSEVMVVLETNEQQSKSHANNRKHNVKRNEPHKVSESDQNSHVVFYRFNSASTDFSQDQKTSQKVGHCLIFLI